MGTPHFASEILKNLIKNEISINCVFTQPDRPNGRDGKISFSEVKKTALNSSLEVLQYQKLTSEAIQVLVEKKPDFIIVAAYGIILPKEVLDIPTFGCINVHASLLPSLRGASPIHNALKLGFTKTGVSVMKMDKGVDTGAVFAKETVLIDRNEKYPELETKLILASNKILIPTLIKIVQKKISPEAQSPDHVSETKMIKKNDGRINWKRQNAKEIFNIFRAFYIWPKTYAFLKGKKSDKKITFTFKNHSNKDYPKEVGQVFLVEKTLLIQTISGTLCVDTIQLEGKNELSFTDFINGKPDFIETILK